MTKRFPAVFVAIAMMFAIVGLATTALQIAAFSTDAYAQSSSVRPPDNAVNTQRTAGGSVRPPANAETNAPAEPGVGRVRDAVDGQEPGPVTIGTEGNNSITTLWGELRNGADTTVSIPDKNAAVLVQDQGMGWLSWRAKGGPLQWNGGIALLGILVALVLFYLIRGRIRIGGGFSGQTIVRFRSIERFAHWVLAGSFIILALSGLNLLYGKDWILPIVGKEFFAQITMAGKWVHNNVAWAFMWALVVVFLLWVRHNIPGLIDLKWFAKGGGLFGGAHPPAKKFNAGQKIVFWSVIILGASISLSGISLLFPYEAPMFAKTFHILNGIGIPQAFMGGPLSTELTPIQEMQYAQIWHTIVAFMMIFIIIAHIYIGSVGMQGAFAAMGSGRVDRNWAKEHHGLWVEEEDRKAPPAPQTHATPAE